MFMPHIMHPDNFYQPIPFVSKLSTSPEGVVVLLGAGASASAGAPLMRGFVDRARDYIKLGYFRDDGLEDIKTTVGFYDYLRSIFRITEEDIENVENILSFAEIADLLPDFKPNDCNHKISSSVRLFIESVLVKSVLVAAPDSSRWLGLGGYFEQYKRLAAALASLGNKATVITLNYDCILEYVCYCMGIPFTYNREYGDGVEILKLHGSINWLSCNDKFCSNYGNVHVAELQYNLIPMHEDGTVEPSIIPCPSCSQKLHPHIVPPTWDKTFSDNALQATWVRAYRQINIAETFVAIGYSLPEADPKVRGLLHAGLSSAKLRQALVVIGNDDRARDRWSKLFRDSWRNYRLDIRTTCFEGKEMLPILQAMSIDPRLLGNNLVDLFPFMDSPANNNDVFKKLIDKFQEYQKLNKLPEKSSAGSLDWVSIAGRLRQTKQTGIRIITEPRSKYFNEYAAILKELGLDGIPTGPILPVHGTEMGKENIEGEF